MKAFTIRAIRGVLLGMLWGTAAALFLRILNAAARIRTWVPSTVLSAPRTIPLFWALILVIVGTSLLLLLGRLGSLAGRVYRSWTAGIVTGIIPVWFVTSVFFFLQVA